MFANAEILNRRALILFIGIGCFFSLPRDMLIILCMMRWKLIEERMLVSDVVRNLHMGSDLELCVRFFSFYPLTLFFSSSLSIFSSLFRFVFLCDHFNIFRESPSRIVQ